MFKEILRALLAVLLPILFAAIVGRYPDFPIDRATFVAFGLWVLEKLLTVLAIVFGVHQYQRLQLYVFNRPHK